MHSSIGTGSLAYVVGSKVMDMRTSSKDDGREAEVISRPASARDETNSDSNGNNNCTDTTNTCKRRSSSDFGDLASVRESTDAAVHDSSFMQPTSPTSVPYKCSTLKHGNEAYESNYGSESYLDFPPLPVTDLFEKRRKDRKGCRSLDDGISTRRRLRFGDEHMHIFRISNNADLVFESNNSAPYNDLWCSDGHSEIESICSDVQDALSRSSNRVYESEMFNRLGISDAPKTPINPASSQGGTASDDRVSEWLWTLHRIGKEQVYIFLHIRKYLFDNMLMLL